MGLIKVLDPITANQIAAGEVVERPASVVKELVENSLDAKATAIEVVISDGGRKNITVKDNGVGIQPEDMVVAFERHATSKISTAEDLNNLISLGFRGEALPSIASVAKVEISSRPKACLAGQKVHIQGGQLLQVEETGCAPGTVISVTDLFYNTPARRKHLKSASAETAQISEIMTRLALAWPGVNFRLISNGKPVLNTPGTGILADTIISVYGQEIGSQLLSIEHSFQGVQLRGFVVRPVLTRNTRHLQTIIVNGRYVRSKIISQAVTDAFHTLLPIGRHPIFVLKLQIDPQKIDANVHPTKMEIRFDTEDLLAQEIESAVYQVLVGANLVPGLKQERPETTSAENYVNLELDLPSPIQPKTHELPRQSRVDSAPLATKNKLESDKHLTERKKAWEKPEVTSANLKDEFVKVELPHEQPQLVKETVVDQPIQENFQNEECTVEKKEIMENDFHRWIAQLVPIGQVSGTYILCQGQDGLVILDQHAVHERILYEDFMGKTGKENFIQQLLIPITLELSPVEGQALIENIVHLRDLGFIVEHFGGNSYLVRGIPHWVSDSEQKEIVLDVLGAYLAEHKSLGAVQMREKAIINMACKAAIKAGEYLSLPLMEELIFSLARTRQPHTCPHGRPTMINFNEYELERRFKRV